MALPSVDSLLYLKLVGDRNTKKFRDAVRISLLADRILGDETPLVIDLTFSGEGDSGDWNEHHSNPYVQHLFDHLLNTKVDFDWYNNDGGGGSITWDVVADVITIDGYCNEVIQHDQPTLRLDADGDEIEDDQEAA